MIGLVNVFYSTELFSIIYNFTGLHRCKTPHIYILLARKQVQNMHIQTPNYVFCWDHLAFICCAQLFWLWYTIYIQFASMSLPFHKQDIWRCRSEMFWTKYFFVHGFKVNTATGPTILYCTVLCFTVMHCTVPILLYCTVMYFTVLYCTVMYFTILYCSVLYRSNPRLLYRVCSHCGSVWGMYSLGEHMYVEHNVQCGTIVQLNLIKVQWTVQCSAMQSSALG